MRTAWTTRRKLLLSLALIPVLLASVELLFRGWLRVTGTPYDAAQTRLQVEAIADQTGRRLADWHAGRDTDAPPPIRIPSPTHGWDHDQAPERIRSLQNYFRSPKGRETYDVLIIGGSVANGFHRDGSQRLIELLRADPRLSGRSVATFCLARGGFKQPQQLNQVTYALAMGIQPDAVINLDGFNEVALGNQNDEYEAHPLHPSVFHWGHLVLFGRADGAMLDGMLGVRRAQKRARSLADAAAAWEWSAVLGSLFRSAMFDARRDHATSTLQYGGALARRGQTLRLFGADYDREFEVIMDQIVVAWSESSLSMHAVCEAHSVYYVHALQPTLHDHGSKPLTSEELRTSAALASWKSAAAHAYPMLRAAGERLREQGVVFVDGSLVLRDSQETLYYDACHFAAPGHVLLAEEIAAGFLAGLPEN